MTSKPTAEEGIAWRLLWYRALGALYYSSVWTAYLEVIRPRLSFMDFEQRLQKAIQRGQNQRDERAREARSKAMSEEDFKRLHSEYRLQLSDHIESCLQRLPNHFPGFRYETIYGDRGWGAACYRDDVGHGHGGKRANFYSRLEMTVRPFSTYRVLDLAAKGTIRNKEVFNRNHFEELTDTDPTQFIELVDLWVLEYAELYSATT